MRGSVPVDQLVAAYGIHELEERLKGMTVEAAFEDRFGQHAVVGDTLKLGGLRLRARTVEKGRVIMAGIKLPQ